MNLKHLTNNQLDTNLLFAVKNELTSTKIVVHHFKESNHRKRYSANKFATMHEYAVSLGYAGGSADRRIKAGRLLDELPEMDEKLEKDIHTVTNLAHAEKYFSDMKIKTKEEKLIILTKIENKTEDQTKKILFSITPEDKKKKYSDTIKRVSETEHQISFLITDETLSKLKKYKSLKGNQFSIGEAFDQLLDLGIKEAEKKKYCELKKSKEKNSPVPEKRLKKGVIPSAIKRAVAKRDGKQCVNCGSQNNINFNHIIPRAHGGNNSIENINLLCFNCNQLQRVQDGLGKHKYHKK